MTLTWAPTSDDVDEFATRSGGVPATVRSARTDKSDGGR
jgi:hypothetical protein